MSRRRATRRLGGSIKIMFYTGQRASLHRTDSGAPLKRTDTGQAWSGTSWRAVLTSPWPRWTSRSNGVEPSTSSWW